MIGGVTPLRHFAQQLAYTNYCPGIFLLLAEAYFGGPGTLASGRFAPPN